MNRKMPKYYTSCGEGVEKTTVDRKTREAKQKKYDEFFDYYGYFYCEVCGRTNVRLDMSHTISVNEAQNTGRAELCWDVENIKFRCRDTPQDCHRKHDKSGLQWGE